MSIIALIQASLGGTATQGAAQLALQAVTKALCDGLREDGEVKLAKFGTFKTKTVASRRLLLPGSGKEMILPARTALRFSPSPHCKSHGGPNTPRA